MNRASSITLDKNRVWHVRKKLSLNEMKKGAKSLLELTIFQHTDLPRAQLNLQLEQLKSVSLKKIEMVKY